jgi:hypothetical protein
MPFPRKNKVTRNVIAWRDAGGIASVNVAKQRERYIPETRR